MAKSYSVQSSFLTGVLDPRAAARSETDAYANALLYGENIEISHLGGARRRRGTLHRATLPNRLEALGTGATVTAPNGGTTANLVDDDETTLFTTTTPVGTTAEYVVASFDLGASLPVTFVDVVNIQSSEGASTDFAVEYSANGTSWNTFDVPLALVDYVTPRCYRRRSEPAATGRYWRLIKNGSTDMGAAVITVADFLVWQETTQTSNVKMVPFEVSADDRYVLALTDRSGVVVHEGVVVDHVPMPYVSADVPDVDAANDAENMVLVHEDYPPQFLVREDENNFQRTPIVFDTVPSYDFNDTLSPTPVSDVQVLTLSGAWVQGNTYQIELNGARSGVVVYSGDANADQRAATAENIRKAVQALFSVRGTTGVACTRTGSGEYTVTLGGASADDYELMSITPVSGSGTMTVAKSASGTSRREPVWSATRGYPRTVTFFEGRLFFGGTRSRQQTLFGSVVGALLDFEQGEGLDDEAIQVTLRGQNLNAISGLYSGRSLQIFTTGGEFRYVKQPGEPITPADAPINQTQYGAASVRPVAIDGATLYAQRNRKSVRDFKYNYEEDAFDSLGISSLAPHLINDIQDMLAWNGSRTDEISLVFVVNGDGTMAVLNSRRDAKVQAWVQWTTQGSFLSGAAVLEDVYFAVLRTIDGRDYVFLEQLSDDVMTDCAVQATVVGDTLYAVDHLDGAVCRVVADGFVMDDATPVGGAITIERTSSLVQAGLNYDPRITPMPLQTTTNASGGVSNMVRKRRIVKVRVKVKDTLGLLLNGRVLADRRLNVEQFDEAQRTPFSGTLSLEESTNWTDGDLLLDLTQVDPQPMNILSIDVQLECNE